MTMSRYIAEFIPTFLSLRAQHIQHNLKQMYKTLLKPGKNRNKNVKMNVFNIHVYCCFKNIYKCQIKLDIIHIRSLFDLSYWTIQWLHFGN